MMIPSLGAVFVILAIALIYGMILKIRIDQANESRRK